MGLGLPLATRGGISVLVPPRCKGGRWPCVFCMCTAKIKVLAHGGTPAKFGPHGRNQFLQKTWNRAHHWQRPPPMVSWCPPDARATPGCEFFARTGVHRNVAAQLVPNCPVLCCFHGIFLQKTWDGASLWRRGPPLVPQCPPGARATFGCVFSACAATISLPWWGLQNHATVVAVPPS